MSIAGFGGILLCIRMACKCVKALDATLAMIPFDDGIVTIVVVFSIVRASICKERSLKEAERPDQRSNNEPYKPTPPVCCSGAIIARARQLAGAWYSFAAASKYTTHCENL